VGSITATPAPERGHVRLDVDWSSQAHSTKCFVYRVVNGITSLIREGDLALLSNGRLCVYDTEAPLDTVMRYRTVAPLNANGDMQLGVEEWTDTTNIGTVGTVTSTGDFFVPGRATRSLKLTQPNSQAVVRAVSEFVPAVAGTSYTLTGQLMVASNWTGGVGVVIHWYNGTTFLSTSGSYGNLWPSVGGWEGYSLTATAPATTTNMRIVAGMQGTPPPNFPLYVGEMYVTQATSTVDTAADLVLAGQGAGWWKDPLHPATAIRLLLDLDAQCPIASGVAFIGVGDRQRPADSNLLEIPGSERGIGVFARRKAKRSSIRIVSATFDDAERVAALHASGAPVLLQLPPAFGEADAYGLYSELTTGRIATDQTVQIQVHAASYVPVRPPVGAPDGVAGTRYSDLTKYSTYAAATAAAATWIDACQGKLAS
jgi:hypothetical protein